jgi:hypothetical protein
MRHLFFTIFLTVGVLSVAQQITVTSSLSASEINKEAKLGHFQWVFPEKTTVESIQNTAKYYTTSFTYTFNQTTKTVDVFPINDSEEVRRVMLRFLGANQVSQIKVGAESYELWSYFESFMKYNKE